MTDTRDHDDHEPSTEMSIVQAAPGLARIASQVAWRTTRFTIGTSLRATRRVARAATSGESAADLITDVRYNARTALRDLLGVEVPWDGPTEPAQGRDRPRSPNGPVEHAESLRTLGEELLQKSADVRYEDSAHPAYERILGELAPDEARVLRFLMLDGPQPAVDVRTSSPLTLNVGTHLVAPGLSMIGAQAGCRYLDRVPAYLNNLFRLGLVWFSREPLRDSLRYQVLEAQPDVIDALHEAKHGRTIRRSIHLTPFGEDFCKICLPPPDTAEMSVIAEPHAAPPEEKATD
jgi:hypothetical protein